MGIPSYFSFILKNYGNIISRLNRKVNNLYLDSNSIIYDSLRQIEEHHNFEERLIHNVCTKIDEYITRTAPNHTIFIAFDGVAPVAKLDQQRNRRYLSTLEKKIRKGLSIAADTSWNSTAITPGTSFMAKLGKYITNYYANKERNYGVQKIIVSTSNEVGEGEHKIFQYIRDHPTFHKNHTTLVYGLDADLIMLCINHLPISRKIFLFRETPEFVKSINMELEPNETYILNIPKLAHSITLLMNNNRPPSTLQQKNRLYDYIFLSFFLGNDFLPHFPSLNIRTQGIHVLLDAYKETIGKTEENLTNGKTIYWKNVRKLITYLAKDELQNIKQEYKIRRRWEKRSFPFKTAEEKMARYLHIPIKNRETEKLIDPFSPDWHTRYYKLLFHQDINDSFREKVCYNYLEGLEWTMHYYTSHCKDWRWSYKYHYPPLLTDLLSYIPHWEMNMIEENNNKPVTPYVQLAYVLPVESLHLLPCEIRERLLSEKSHYYNTDSSIQWTFCKYFWESHVELPNIDIAELENIIK